MGFPIDTAKKLLKRLPFIYRPIHGSFKKAKAAHLAFRCYSHDARRAVAHMNWHRPKPDYWKLSSELIFQYHKLEKGLSISGPKRFFGAVPAVRTCRLMQEWVAAGFRVDDPVYAGAAETLRSYRRRMEETPPPADQLPMLEKLVADTLARANVSPDLATPFEFRPSDPSTADVLEALCQQRRSVRDFASTPVDPALVERAVRIAQLSPSACNRQPWRVHLYTEREIMDRMLALQNGNKGFGHTIPLLVVLTADANCFFDSTERSEPYLDGGLFLMSFILALQSLGLSSCCLNWCVSPQRDIQGHKTGNIPDNEIIITYLAVGHARPQSVVPRSARRITRDIIIHH